MVDVQLEPITDSADIQQLLNRTAEHELQALVETFGLGDTAAEQLTQRAASSPRDTSRLFRIVSEGTAVGWMWTDIVPTANRGDEPWLLNIEIDPDQRGRGLGRASIEALRRMLQAEGFTTLDLTVYGSNFVAEGLYRSMQFRPMRTHLRLDL